MIRHEPCIVIEPYIKELTIEKYQSGIKLIYLKSRDQNTIHIDIDNNDMVWALFSGLALERLES